ncbi:MAG: hypothetical protein PHT69_01070 [Bacteroidales bacterium]|nr:hypothetical protein [Bacteroidales bacterium]
MESKINQLGYHLQKFYYRDRFYLKNRKQKIKKNIFKTFFQNLSALPLRKNNVKSFIYGECYSVKEEGFNKVFLTSIGVNTTRKNNIIINPVYIFLKERNNQKYNWYNSRKIPSGL